MMKMIPCLAILCAACSPAPGPVVPKTAVERQMIGLLEKFDRWDEDGDGTLDEAEITNGLKGKDTPYTGRQVVDFYDRSGDGRISLREAQAGYARADELDSQTRH